MNLFEIWLAFVLLVPFRGQEEGLVYLRKAAEKFAGITDYTVDVRVHLDMQDVRGPDMNATIYYKSPDRVKIDSKGTFLLPKEIGVFNPAMFNPDKFNIAVEDTLQYEGHPAVRLALSPKKEALVERRIILTIDKMENLIREISIQPGPGSLMDARIKYGKSGSFELPIEIDVNLNLPKADSSQQDFNSRPRFRGGMAGSVTVYYSNYRVNTGLSDSLFERSQDSSGHR
jgi:hypothetical protein